MIISLIAAMAKNRTIGKGNNLPWNLPSDMRRFVKLTMGKPILMGRKTHESIGKPLGGRTNIILTSDVNYRADGCVVVHTIEDALNLPEVKNCEELAVIGGESLYKLLLPRVERIYLTVIHKEFDGDAYFPGLDMAEWKEIHFEEFEKSEHNPLAYCFMILERK